MAVLRTLRGAGKQGWLAGGAVRDLVRGKGAEDFDVATDALPEQVMKLFPRVVPTGVQHGTVLVLSGEHKVEVTTFRGEGAYHDGRRPSAVTFLSDIDGDLARRDFTVNAIAWDPIAGALRDPFSGVEDLRRCLLRAVGDPLARFRRGRPAAAARRPARLHAPPGDRAAHPPRHSRDARRLRAGGDGARPRRADQAAAARGAAEPRAPAAPPDRAARPHRPRAAGVGELPAEPLPPLGRLAAHDPRGGFRSAGPRRSPRRPAARRGEAPLRGAQRRRARGAHLLRSRESGRRADDRDPPAPEVPAARDRARGPARRRAQLVLPAGMERRHACAGSSRASVRGSFPRCGRCAAPT